MKTNEKPFLHSYAEEFKKGDIVTWRSFDQNENYETIILDFVGAIIEVVKRKNYDSTRSVYYAVVLPFGRTKTIEVPFHILKKQTI
jgi:hypothetical protein